MATIIPPRCITDGTPEQQAHRIGFVLTCLGETIQESEGRADDDFHRWLERLSERLDLRHDDEEWFRNHFRHLLHAAGLG